jgi:hypothetical protein
MYKRISVRFVNDLATALIEISKKRGLSVNSLISEMAWAFVEDWKAKQKEPTTNKPA